MRPRTVAQIRQATIVSEYNRTCIVCIFVYVCTCTRCNFNTHLTVIGTHYRRQCHFPKTVAHPALCDIALIFWFFSFTQTPIINSSTCEYASGALTGTQPILDSMVRVRLRLRCRRRRLRRKRCSPSLSSMIVNRPDRRTQLMCAHTSNVSRRLDKV